MNSCFREQKKLAEKLDSQIQTLANRNEQLECDNKNLRDEKFELEKKVNSPIAASSHKYQP